MYYIVTPMLGGIYLRINLNMPKLVTTYYKVLTVLLEVFPLPLSWSGRVQTGKGLLQIGAGLLWLKSSPELRVPLTF